MGQQESVGSPQTRLTQAAAAQSAKAPVLHLHTAGAANRAYLQQDGSGRVSLYFRGLHYGVDDYVPNSLTGSRSASSGGTAGQFICRQMLARHGYDEDAWPALARGFLLQHARIHANTRSRRRHRPAGAERVTGRRALEIRFPLAELFRQGTLTAW